MIPPEQNGEFVVRMEAILDPYCLPYAPAIPLICMDEQPIQSLKETRTPLPARPGPPARVDGEYERNGAANSVLFTEPLQGHRHVHVRPQRTAVAWANEIQHLLEVEDPEPDRIRLVCDNLNTHKLGSLCDAFAPETARRLAQRLDLHYAPKHGSWLNIAERELRVLTRQCLDRPIPNLDTLRQDTLAWEAPRNTAQKGVHWQFTTPDTRIKLRRLYPQIKT